MYNPQLKTFFAVIEAGSFSAASAQLYLTPSAVLHQIRALEKDLGAELFIRSSKGIALTPAGAYLAQQGRVFMQKDEEIRREIRNITAAQNSICVGTSMLEKCRLLYELWMLFSSNEKDCEIQMVNIDPAHNIPDCTDLIESFNSEASWMHNWEFLEVCCVPFGLAVVNNHPFAAKKLLTLDDLRGEVVHTINSGTCETIAALLRLLEANDVKVAYDQSTGINTFWEPAFTRSLQLVPLCFHDILINMTVVPFEKDFSLPYGFFYRPNPSAAVSRFLDFIRATYSEGNANGIVPVLT